MKDINVFPELYTSGSRIWIKHSTEVWQCAVVKKTYKPNDKELLVEDEESQEVTVSVESPSALPPLRNPDILIGANDLTSLSYLHEPAVLYNLRIRFLDQNAIYTWCGIVLVAINPFTDLEIYGEETIQTYHKSQGTTQLDPHIYAVAEDAYSKLERDNYNQSVIVSGESGAGKTVSAKFAMRYFASIAGSQTSNIENRVLASNPIMEAIGNAKTTRNDNSSRFGKYIQILFDPQTRAITGGNMRTYLLEKSRVSRQSEGERNFHIFYQMCTFAKRNNLKHLKLDSQTEFNFLGQIEPTQYDDLDKFVDAMQCLGFTEKQQNLIQRVVAAILHGGNVEFIKNEEEGCTISNESDFHLNTFCELLGLDESATRHWLTHRLLRTGTKEVITTSLNSDLAQYGRDGLVKFIYEKMFAWIVALINKALGPTTQSVSFQFIGVLDIYGFEHFENNSFEQFCINYANEVLQQQFNQHVFKLEQEEYVREGIDWKFITFTDNQPVIDLIESKPIGILNLLDEECKMPKGTDETMCAKLYQQLTVGDVFQKSKFGSKNTFIIQHFADKVIYQVDGFLEKNRDTIWEEQIDLVKRSSIIDCLFLDDFSSEPLQKSGGKMKITPQQQQQRQQKQAKATVGSQFRESLAALMKTLNATEPHYVRCIKPNDYKQAFEFNNVRAVQQLRACGVLETIRISSNGFPSRWSYQDFANRYRVLKVGQFKKVSIQKSGSAPKPAPRKLVRASSNSSSEIRILCEEIVKIVYEEQAYSQFKLPQEQSHKQAQLYQFGKTKIFFRSGQVALLERIRAQKLRECAVLLQRMIRGYIVRRRYIKIRYTILRLQCYGRSFLARKLCLHLKQTKAATIIQTKWRSWIARKKYLMLKKSVCGLQRFGRGLLARRRFLNIKCHLAAVTIQRYLRGFLVRKQYQARRRKIVLAQSLVRRWLARREFKKLKIEARSVEHVTKLNRGLERKIIELQQKIEDYHGELKALKHMENVFNDFKRDSEKLEVELKNARNELKQKESEIDKINGSLIEAKNLNATFQSEIDKQKGLIEQLKSSSAQIKLQSDPKLIEEAVVEREKILTSTFEKEKKMLIEEAERERESRQQLLRKYMELEERSQSGRGEDDEDRDPDISAVSLMMRCSELEQDCAKFKHENQKMRELLANVADEDASGYAASLLAKQCADMQLELDRSREERSQLKTIVLSQESNIKDPSGGSELISAFKAIIKQLENEVDESKIIIKQLRQEIESLKSDNNRQQELIGINSSAILAKGGDELITKIGQENTLLREKCDKLSNENKQLKMELMRRNILENGGDDDVVFSNDQNTQFLGMYEYKQQNESLILKILITDLDPNLALKFPPHIPAYIVFMCIRYTDYNNDDAQVRSLLNSTIITLKKTVKKQQNIESLVLWLSNTCKLITCLKQYSGEEIFGDFEESLKNFDLSEYRQIFSDIAIWIYQGVIKQSEERIQSMIVPAILEHEGLASSGMYSQSIQKTGSVTDDTLAPSPTEKPIDALIKELSYLHRILLLHVIESEIIHQIFKQLFYFICAGSLNNLLLRKDLCHWNKAMQIRFNLSSLEQWCREQQIPKWNEVVEKLEPIIQATKLLQTRKTEEHIPTIVEMCNKLSSSQIIKILNLYTAGDEERISSTFIKKVQQFLVEQRKSEGVNITLLMDTKFSFAFTIPYNPSDVKLQSINLPPVLVKKGLATVLRKI